MSACFNIPLYFCRTRCSFVHQALPGRVRKLKEWAWFWNWWRRGTSCRYFWVLPVDSKTHTASPLCITVVWLTTSVALSSLSHCWHFYVINWKHDYKTLTGQRKWVNVDNWRMQINNTFHVWRNLTSLEIPRVCVFFQRKQNSC